MVSYKPDKFYLVNDFFSWRTEISNLKMAKVVSIVSLVSVERKQALVEIKK